MQINVLTKVPLSLPHLPEWIVTGYSVFQHLLSPKFLCHNSAPPLGGEIRLHTLHNWPYPGRPLYFPPLVEGEEEVSQIGGRYFPSKENCRVLNVGCGNSRLGENMLRDGYKDVVNVDYSSVVINKMKEKYTSDFFVDLKESLDRGMRLRNQLGLVDTRDDHASESNNAAPMPKMTFEVADATLYIPHPDESFDIIIVKKTLDMILCSEGSIASAKQMMSECFRLLKKDHGVMIILSSAKPEDRAFFFEQNPWSGKSALVLFSNMNSCVHHQVSTAGCFIDLSLPLLIALAYHMY